MGGLSGVTDSITSRGQFLISVDLFTHKCYLRREHMTYMDAVAVIHSSYPFFDGLKDYVVSAVLHPFVLLRWRRTYTFIITPRHLIPPLRWSNVTSGKHGSGYYYTIKRGSTGSQICFTRTAHPTCLYCQT